MTPPAMFASAPKHIPGLAGSDSLTPVLAEPQDERLGDLRHGDSMRTRRPSLRQLACRIGSNSNGDW